MPKTEYKSIELLPHQIEFVSAPEKEILLSGAWGAGKSQALCYKILKEASSTPGSEILLTRKTYTSLKRSTLQTLLGGDNPVLPPGSYRFNKIEQCITLNSFDRTKSRIWMCGLDDMLKIRSMNLSMVAVDELTEIDLDDYIELKGRIRNKIGCRQIIGATNPATPSHWAYNYFLKEKKDDRKIIQAKTTDNTYLPEDYLESLKELPEDVYRRFVLGEWLTLENAIYSNIKENVKIRSHGEFISYVLGVDFGFTNPTAVLFAGLDGDGNIHILDEHTMTKTLISDIVSKVEPYQRMEPVVIVDPSAPALIAEFEQDGYTSLKANNAVEDGISVVRNYLHAGKITIDPKCEQLIEDLSNYSRDENGKPMKVNDHLPDALRYLTMYVFSGGSGTNNKFWAF